MLSVKLLSDIIGLLDEEKSSLIMKDKKDVLSVSNKICIDKSIQYMYDIDAIKNFVTKKIIEMQEQYDFRVLFAVERSSHIWGTSHSKSDNDIQCIMFYRKREYYSLINLSAENARNNQNKRVNIKNRKKLRELEIYKDIKFIRDIKIQYGDRLNIDNNIHIKDKNDKLLDVEISYHEISKWMNLINESNQNLYEIISSPIIYYHLYDMNHMNKMRDIIYNLYDYVDLSNNYYHIANKNHSKLFHRNKNRTNKDPKMRIKTLFVIWRAIFMAKWLIHNKTVHNMPLYLPYLIKNTLLLNDTEKYMLMNKLKNGINKGLYECDDQFDVLSHKIKYVLDELNKNIQSEMNIYDKNKRLKIKEINQKALEHLVMDMIEGYHKFGDVKMLDIKYNFKVHQQCNDLDINYKTSDLLKGRCKFLEKRRKKKINIHLNDELLLRMDDLILLTQNAIDNNQFNNK